MPIYAHLNRYAISPPSAPDLGRQTHGKQADNTTPVTREYIILAPGPPRMIFTYDIYSYTHIHFYISTQAYIHPSMHTVIYVCKSRHKQVLCVEAPRRAGPAPGSPTATPRGLPSPAVGAGSAGPLATAGLTFYMKQWAYGPNSLKQGLQRGSDPC